MDNNIEKFLKKESGAGLVNGDRWLVWDPTAKEWKTLAGRNSGKLTGCVYRGQDLDEALRILGEDGD